MFDLNNLEHSILYLCMTEQVTLRIQTLNEAWAKMEKGETIKYFGARPNFNSLDPFRVGKPFWVVVEVSRNKVSKKTSKLISYPTTLFILE